MKIAVTGSTGLIGNACSEYFENKGALLTRILRPSSAGAHFPKVAIWDPVSKTVDKASLEGIDLVINLAGENVAGGRWSRKRKRIIKSSRVDGTRFLVETLATLKKPPKVLINASAIGFYGDRPPHEELDEASAPGEGFLSEVAKDWEREAGKASQAGIRTIIARIGIVFSPRGGALKRMMDISRLFLGGKLGSGEQIVSWIALEDIPPIMEHLYQKDNLEGVFNLVAPNPVSNSLLTKELAKSLGRPAFLCVPSFLIRILKGHMGEELLLKGARVLPKRLLETGYKFLYSNFEEYLRDIIRATY